MKKIKLKKSFDLLPGNNKLEEALGEIFEKEVSEEGGVSILTREKCIMTSTHPSEIVTCTLPGNIERHLFIKYEVGTFLFINDHRKSLDYEVRIYDEVLSRIAMSTPQYYGTFTFRDSNIKMLVIEFIEDLIRFPLCEDPNAIYMAARWLGEFHNRSHELIKQNKANFIHKYDEAYFLQWAKKTTDSIINSKLENKFQWLLNLSDQFQSHISELTEADPVIIHSEFYPQNVYYAKGTIHPIDWQTAALGVGEIDFASLTQNWPEDMIELCVKEYRTIRKSNEPIEKFKKRVLMARIYFNFVWLSYKPEAAETGNPFMDELMDLAVQFDLIF